MYLNETIPHSGRKGVFEMGCTLTEFVVRIEMQKLGFAHDKTKDGWELLEEGPPRLVEPADLHLSTFLDEGETYANGEEMLQRSINSVPTCGPLAGQHQAEQLLEQQDQIPAELRDKVIVFLATKWRGSDGARYVPYLYWLGSRWQLRFYWLGHGYWDASCLVARLPQVPSGA